MPANDAVRRIRSEPRQRGTAPDRTAPRAQRNPLLSCRIRINLPERAWAHAFTTANPQLRLEVLDRLEVGNGATLLEVRVVSHEGRDWGAEIRSIGAVQEVECLDGTAGSETYRILARGPSFIPLLKKLKLLRHFPFPIQDGWATWTVVGPESKVRALLANLESSHVHFELEAITHGSLTRPPSSLTPRQKEILARALAEGYFDVPRRITLTQLAPKIGVAMSTLSVTLAVIEKKVLEPRA